MVQNTLQIISRGPVNNEALTPVMLTPTTLKNLTDLFESDHCLKQVQAVENGEEFVAPQPPPSQEKKRKNPLKLESTPFVGGTVLIRTPTDSEQTTILDPAPAPAPRSQILAMKTRSSSRTRTPTAVVQPQMVARKQATVKRTPPKSRPGVKAVQDDSDLSPDEVERLRIRRERNKQAAARCRKRRMDTISTLEDEVRQLEKKRHIHEDEIANLREQKMQLEYILSQHQAECKLFNQMSNFDDHDASSAVVPASAATTMSLPMAVKSEPVVVQAIEQMYHVMEPNLSSAAVATGAPRSSKGGLKPKRPLTLTISQSDINFAAAKTFNTSVEGVTIETPSNGLITSLGFENLLTSTGLTPTTNIITPISFTSSAASSNSCSSQQRTSELSLTDLNTPSNENISLVSL
jgi:hypothetical protein